MSSLSRRACFKCGNVGHYAGKRSSASAEGYAAARHGRKGYSRNGASLTILASRTHELCGRTNTEHATNVDMQRCAPRRRDFATTVSIGSSNTLGNMLIFVQASSLVMSPTDARILALPRVRDILSISSSLSQTQFPHQHVNTQ